MISNKIIGNIADYKGKNLERDYANLSREDMLKGHQKLVTIKGREILVSLEEQESFKGGDVIYLNENLIVYVELMDEDILYICPKGELQWAKIAFNLGNMHKSTYLLESAILTPFDEQIEVIIQSIDIPYERIMGKLEGERANVQGKRKQRGSTHRHRSC